MDPLIEFATRNSATFPSLSFDQRFVYNTDSYQPTFALTTEQDIKLYAEPELIDMLEKEQSAVYVPKNEEIVMERANPFIKIPKFVPGAEMKVFNMLFNFKGTWKAVHPNRRHINFVIQQELLESQPSNNLLVSLPHAVNRMWMHFVYLMSKLYRRVTLLQLAMSQVRYLVAMDYVGREDWKADLRSIVAFESARELTGIFSTVPDCFQHWFTFMNNVHLAKRVENLLLLKAQKDAYDSGSIYTKMPSYDFKRVLNLLNGLPVIQEGVRSKSFKFLNEIDEQFISGLHLFGTPANFKGNTLHRQINLQTDMSIPYSPTSEVNRGGIHWGQRKLLLAEIEFFSHFLEADDKAVAFYIGAAPFDHGPVLFEMFPNITFILCDPRNVWNAKVSEEATGKRGARVHLLTKWMTEEVLSAFLDELQDSNVETPTFKAIRDATKFFFLSDIRSTSHDEVGNIENEIMVDKDMTTQKRFGNMIADVLKIPMFASYKFRLPFIEEIGGPDYAYAGGLLRTQAWSRLKSTELRLWWSPSDTDTTYNKKKLEDVMMYHNTVLRQASFGNTGVLGYCECHDCHMEVAILKEYIAKHVDTGGRDVKDIVSGYVSLFNGSLKMTLAQHAESDRKRTKNIVLYRNSDTKRPLYNPIVEIAKSNVAFEHQAEFVKVLKSSNGFKDVDVENIKTAFSMILLANYFEFGKYDLPANIDVINEFTGVNLDELTIGKLEVLNSEILKKLETSLKAMAPEAAIDLHSVQLSGQDGFFNITSRGEKPVATMRFHKDLFKRFLVPSERDIEKSNSELRRDLKLISRGYALLKRFGPMWHPHLAYSLTESWPLRGMQEGLTFLGSDEYGVFVTDLELPYSDRVSILQLKSLIVPENVITIFAPPVRYIWSLYFVKSVQILDKYKADSKAIVMIVPSKYDQTLPATLLAYEDVSQRRPFAEKVMDVMKNRDVELPEPHVVRVFRTTGSDFQISH